MTSPHRLVQGIETWAGRTPDAVAVIDGDRRVRFAELRDLARAAGGAFARAGIGPADRVAYLGRNSVEQVALTAGAAMLGAVAVPLNARLAPREIAAVVDHMDARLVIVEPALLGLAREARSAQTTRPPTLVLGDGDGDAERGWAGWAAGAEPLPPAAFAALDDDALAAQLYTSGTTGRPKGVMLSAAGLRWTVDRLAEIWGLTADAVLMPVLPWFHVGGIYAVAGALSAGASVVVQNEVSGQAILEGIERHGVTSIVVAPIMMQWMHAHPRAREFDLSTLRNVSYGASTITGAQLAAFLDLVPTSRVVQVYGLTETSGLATVLDDAAHRDPAHPERLTSAGRPVRGLELLLLDPHTREPVAPGGVGEVWVRYVGCMLGYYKAPDLTAEVFRDGGWMRTNDLGRQDDGGFLHLCDRVGDMIVSGGENIFPSEVEDAIAGHPDVAAVGVVGVPHERWGETPKAFVVPVPGARPDAADIIGYARDRLAHYKCPTSVELVEALPRNPSGKLLRRVLRDQDPAASGTRLGTPGTRPVPTA